MAKGTHSVELQVPIQKVWDFVSDMNNWAPLISGYITHDLIHDKKSIWEFYGDLGFMKKKITLEVNIQEWTEPTRVSFQLKGISDNFTGGGYFEARQLSEQATTMTGHLEIIAGGMMAAMMNPVLNKFVPEITEELTVAISNNIKKHQIE